MKTYKEYIFFFILFPNGLPISCLLSLATCLLSINSEYLILLALIIGLKVIMSENWACFLTTIILKTSLCDL